MCPQRQQSSPRQSPIGRAPETSRRAPARPSSGPTPRTTCLRRRRRERALRGHRAHGGEPDARWRPSRTPARPPVRQPVRPTDRRTARASERATARPPARLPASPPARPTARPAVQPSGRPTMRWSSLRSRRHLAPTFTPRGILRRPLALTLCADPLRRHVAKTCADPVQRHLAPRAEPSLCADPLRHPTYCADTVLTDPETRARC